MQCVEPQSVELQPETQHTPPGHVSAARTSSPQTTVRQRHAHTSPTQVESRSAVSFSQTVSLKRKDRPVDAHRACSDDEVAIIDSGLHSGSYTSGKRRRVLRSFLQVPSEHERFDLYISRGGRRVLLPVPPAATSYGKFHVWLQDVLTTKHDLSCNPGICSFCLSHSYHQTLYRHMMDSHITPAMGAFLNNQSTPQQQFLLFHYSIIVDITRYASSDVVKECIKFSSAHRDRHPSTVTPHFLASDYPKLRDLAMFLSKARLRPQDWVPKYKWVCGCRSRFPTLEELKQHVEDEEKLIDTSNRAAGVSSDLSVAAN